MKSLKLMRQELDKQFREWSTLKRAIEPKEGWMKLIRVALGMTTYQFAKRLGVNQSRVIKMEAAVANHNIRISTLERVAEALDCQLVFGLVPNTSLEDIVQAQARRVAAKEVAYVAHSMSLEDQAVDQKTNAAEIHERVQELLAGPEKKLWVDE